MVSQYSRASSNRSVGDQITAVRMQALCSDLDALFKRLDPRDLSMTYNISKQLTQIVDNQNSITVNLDRSDRGQTIPKIYIQEVGDPKIFTCTYASKGGAIQTIVYA